MASAHGWTARLTAAMRRVRQRQIRCQKPDLECVLKKILFGILLTLTIVVSIAYIPSVMTAWHGGFYDTVIIDTLVYLWLIYLLFDHRMSYKTRVIGFVSPMWLLGAYLLLRFDQNGAGYMWLFAVPVLCSLLLNLRAGLIALVLNISILVIPGILISIGRVGTWGTVVNPGALWALMSGNFIALNAMLTVSVALTLDRLRQSLSELERQKTELAKTKEATIETVASLAEFRDSETGHHIQRTRLFVSELASAMSEDPEFEQILNPEYVDLLTRSAPLHDIGKIGIPDRILLKQGKLTEDEYEFMKLHTVFGRDVLLRSEKQLGSNGFLQLAAEVAYTHQERWNGSGYPQGLKGESIPLSGRIMAVADVYDAMRSQRPYKQPFSHDETIDYMRDNAGVLFDPKIIEKLLGLEQRFKAIHLKLADD